MTKCTVCRSPHRDAIDIDLINGTPVRDIAERYGFKSHHSIQRHNKPEDGKPSHIQERLRKNEVKSAKSLQNRIDEIYDTSFGLVKMAIDLKDPRAAAYCLMNAVKVVEILGKSDTASESDYVPPNASEADIDAKLAEYLNIISEAERAKHC